MRLALLVACMGILGGGDTTGAQSAGMSSQALRQIDALLTQKAQRPPAQRKVDSSLVPAARMRRRETVANGVPRLRRTVEADDTVTVDVTGDVTGVLLADILTLGGTIVATVPRYERIRVRLPLEQVDAAAAQATDDALPVTAVTGQAEEGSEGTARLEIVFDLTPCVRDQLRHAPRLNEEPPEEERRAEERQEEHAPDGEPD